MFHLKSELWTQGGGDQGEDVILAIESEVVVNPP